MRPSPGVSPARIPAGCGSTSTEPAVSSAIPTWAREGYRSSSPRWMSTPTTARTRRGPMDIDLSVLKSLEAEKDISMDLVIKAIEDALLVAYHKTEGAAPSARVEVDRRTGNVTVWAAETDDNGTVLTEYDDTPAGFGRIAATTAGQVILQRLRDA